MAGRLHEWPAIFLFNRDVPTYTYALLTLGWLFWLMPFVMAQRRHTRAAGTLDLRARWGVIIQGISYALLWQNRFWLRPLKPWQPIASVVLFAVGITLAWSATRALGKQWRVDAGLNADHELVKSGPYRLLRHPVYASMFSVLLATGFLITPWRLFLLAALVFLTGTEIRVQIEDRLLASRFGENFEQYRRSRSAYVPFVR